MFSNIHVGELNLESLSSRILGSKVLVLCSSSVYELTHVDSVINSLQSCYDVYLHCGLSADAPIEEIESIIEKYPHEAPDTIIAIGGGSILDAGKGLSVAFKGVHLKDFLYKKAALPETGINTIAVPTTAGTGAETSFGAILFDKEKNFKGGIRGKVLCPNHVIIDVDLYMKAPLRIKSEVGFDCLTHAIETYLSKSSTPLVKYNSIAAINTVFKHLRDAVSGNKNAMEKMAIASCIMGYNLAQSSTCLPHRIQYVVGPRSRSTHAQGLIALYRGWLPMLLLEPHKSGYEELQNELNLNRSLFEEINKLKDDLNINYSLTTLGLEPKDTNILADSVTGSLDLDPIYKNKNTINNLIKASF